MKSAIIDWITPKGQSLNLYIHGMLRLAEDSTMNVLEPFSVPQVLTGRTLIFKDTI
ncbi:hypothetical protein SCLCIDRAFT_34779 [Scleroderma citrinum Foug A]|uniref:Uncharacterized protein n=1 Tax=Scleroderma citrinum Foug A TaxID=1036808 RepID=A0A0C2ZA76_9AGAM|nr:hypothetical protein SCLCIDRAFT_34779 [Scleroderma citrinum Foug A]